MKTLIRMMFGVTILAYASGCASMLATSYHNDNAVKNAKVFQMKQLSGGEPAIAMDWAAITPGYMAAWREMPGVMTGATALDLITVGGGIYFATKGSGGGDDKAEPAVQVNGNNNTTYVNTGSGDQTVTIDQSSNGE